MKKYQPIRLCTKVEIHDHPENDEAMSDLLDIVDSIGHEDITFNIDWTDEMNVHFNFKKWLVDTYGKEIKMYNDFILIGY